jgi:hypothetical protein
MSTRDDTRTRIPDRSEGEHAVDEARLLFRRTLATWTSDLLELRRTSGADGVWQSDDEASWRLAA